MPASQDGAANWPPQGSWLPGRAASGYRVGPLLRQGSSARLYAITTAAAVPLVLKVLPPHGCQGEDGLLQWQREVSLQSRVQHAAVLRLWDAFRYGPYGCLVLERADLNLEDWIRLRGPLQSDEVFALADHLLQGLEAIHRAGILHLDLAPSNVLLQWTPSGAPRLLIADFGIAVDSSSAIRLSRPSAGWAHLPPELLRPGAHRPTPRSDLYSLGLTLLFARRGSLPVSDLLPLPELQRLLSAGVLRQQAERLEPPLATCLATLLQEDPQRRFRSADEALRCLRQQRDHKGASG